jgi:GTP-dependent phosphoenolpyruvate carboxykinase
MTQVNAPEFVRHPKLIAWVEEIAKLTKPAKIEWCDGSEEEYQRLIDLMIANGTMQKLNEEKHPGSYLRILTLLMLLVLKIVLLSALQKRRCWCNKQLGRPC